MRPISLRIRPDKAFAHTRKVYLWRFPYDADGDKLALVVAAAIGALGAIAAGKLLSDPQYIDLLANPASKDWEHKNVQVVLTTQVINGQSGPPHILDTQCW